MLAALSSSRPLRSTASVFSDGSVSSASTATVSSSLLGGKLSVWLLASACWTIAGAEASSSDCDWQSTAGLRHGTGDVAWLYKHQNKWEIIICWNFCSFCNFLNYNSIHLWSLFLTTPHLIEKQTQQKPFYCSTRWRLDAIRTLHSGRCWPLAQLSCIIWHNNFKNLFFIL